MDKSFIEELNCICKSVAENEPMMKHTTFRIGGPADVFVCPDESEIAQVIDLCKKENVPFMIMGNGSNMLVSDAGIEGVVISLGNAMGDITVEGCQITAGAGAILSKVANAAYDNSLTGFEFAAGIPGSVGGAVVMNAGAYGGEIKDCLKSVKVLTAEGRVETRSADSLNLSYRHSVFMEEKGAVVLSATFEFEPGNRDEIKGRMDELKTQRVEKQPLNFPSAGSTFKRPEGYFAGKLIDDAGLRGFCINDAAVSEKHCGFVVNKGNATCDDVLKLMKHVDEVVFERNGVHLEPEIRIVGRF